MTFIVGIIGAGRMGRLHVNNLQLLPERVLVKSVSDNVYLDTWRANKNIKVLTKNYRDILKDEEVDAVFICSPTETHCDMIKEVASAGKNIFCEAPISFTIEEVEAALEEVEKAGVKLQIGFNLRFDPNFRKVHKFVRNGEIGKPRILRLISHDPYSPYKTSSNSSYTLMDLSMHEFDIARYIMGCEVIEVSTYGGVFSSSDLQNPQDLDTAMISLKFENGALGIIEKCHSPSCTYDQRLEILGEKGLAQADNNQTATVELATNKYVKKEKPPSFLIERYKQSYIAEIGHFVKACMENHEVSCKGFDGLQSVRIAKAAKKSLETAKSVKL
ncbi:Gfo/Idh/MocA family oxidoreductase [Bacillus sp. FJAT-27251]|uniref:Gfo/Idh/MocA family oxidoreductase n=1 Tax=Bacillus sp. FJAT-27251 TaxID=1684142 RepID=UPI0006A76364|nr:Gfo/Idh/MocA family oxidoreductase [Bacillus sp. FJAT-27251]